MDVKSEKPIPHFHRFLASRRTGHATKSRLWKQSRAPRDEESTNTISNRKTQNPNGYKQPTIQTLHSLGVGIGGTQSRR